MNLPLASRARWQVYAKGEIVTVEGDTTNDVFFIAEGAVRVVVRTASGYEMILADRNPKRGRKRKRKARYSSSTLSLFYGPRTREDILRAILSKLSYRRKKHRSTKEKENECISTTCS